MTADLVLEVGTWHRSIFGEHDPLLHVRAIGQKAREEAAELEADPGPKELADLFVCALAAADRLGMDADAIAAAVREKLAILRARGLGQLDRDRERGIMQAADQARMLAHHGLKYPAAASQSVKDTEGGDRG